MTNESAQLDLYWFSGSGNTLFAAETFAERLREHGWIVRLVPIERADPGQINSDAMFGIAFPTYCFSLSEKVRAFVNGLPRVEGTGAIMLGTHGALSGGVLGPMKRLLLRRGFRCISGRIVRMPDSFFPFFSEQANHRQIARAQDQIKRYADAIVEGKARWPRWPVLSDICNILGYGTFSLRRLLPGARTTVHTKRKLCTGCGACVRRCPVGAIVLSEHSRILVRHDHCVNCLRCVAVCPRNAQRHMIGFSPYRMESASELQTRFDRQITASPEVLDEAH